MAIECFLFTVSTSNSHQPQYDQNGYVHIHYNKVRVKLGVYIIDEHGSSAQINTIDPLSLWWERTHQSDTGPV